MDHDVGPPIQSARRTRVPPPPLTGQIGEAASPPCTPAGKPGLRDRRQLRVGQEPWTPAPEAPGLAFLLLPRAWKSRRGWGPAGGPARERELAGAGDSAAVGPGLAWPRAQATGHLSWWAASGGLKHLTFREPKAPSRAPLASASRPELHHPCPLLCTPITRELLVKPLPSSQATRPQLMTAHISLLPSHTLQPDDTPALGVQGP